MAQSMFSYRGGARSRGVAGQPTGYGGAPMGSPGQTAMQAFRSAAIGGGQSITSAPSAPPQPTRTPSPTPGSTPLPAAPSPTPGSTPLPAAPSLTPGSTTPMFKPAFALPNTAMARYVGSLAAQTPAPMQRQAPVAAQPTAVQRAVQATPIGFGMTEAQRQGVGGPQAKRYDPHANNPLVNNEAIGNPNPSHNRVPREREAPEPGPVVGDTRSDSTGNWVLTENGWIPADQATANAHGLDQYIDNGALTPSVPTITTDDNGNVLVNGVPITDPNAEGADERSQAQRMLDDAEAVSRQEYEQATQQIDANQILQALAKAGEQGMRGGMSGFGLGEQGIVQQNALKGQLMASSNLASALSSLAAQQQSLDRDEYDRLKEAYDMNSEEGRAGFARVRRQSEIAQKIQKLQEGGVTPDEQAQIATLGAEYAELDAANKAALAKQIGNDNKSDVFDDDGVFNSDKYDGDPNGPNVTRDPALADAIAQETVDDFERYANTLRSKFGQDLGDNESARYLVPTVNTLVSRAQKGDPVSTKVLRDLGLGHLINGGFEGTPLLDEIDIAMDRIFDNLRERGLTSESEYFDGQFNQSAVPPSLKWLYEKTGGPPPTGQLE